MPLFVKLDKTAYLFTVDGATYQQAGNYKIGWKIGYTEYPEAQVECTVPLEIKYVPESFGKTFAFQTLVCKFPWSLEIPTFTDNF